MLLTTAISPRERRLGGSPAATGATPSPDQVSSQLWESVLAQFIVEGCESGIPKGLIAISSPNFRDGFAYLSALGSPAAQGLGLMTEAVLLACNYAFTTWPLRKLYMEASEVSLRGFRSGLASFFVEEGPPA